MRRIYISAFVLLLLGIASCGRDSSFEPGFAGGDSGGRSLPGRSYTENTRRVMIMISAGFNSLSSYLSSDTEDLENGYLPEGNYFYSDVVLVLSRIAQGRDYSQQKPPVLYQLYKGRNGEVIRDTLKRWEDDTPLSRPETVYDALSFIQRKFPAGNYGLVFSSHASGWLPAGFYSDPSAFASPASPRGYRSLGQDVTPDGDVEMELQEFAEAIPMHLDYLLIDACLSGCVEIAYAFRDKADKVGFSPTEVLADGFNYEEITSHLLGQEPDPVAVCKEYFEYYDSQKGQNRSATISVVDTRQMDGLATVCRELFEKYRPQIASLDGNLVQGYFRFDRHYFYDLKDILVQAGITTDEERRLDAALDKCILYKAATDYFLSIPIRRYSGLSMYLPSMGTSFLDQFYRTRIDWNTATQLVK